MHKQQCILFDWGDTIMRDFPDFGGPMVTWPKIEVLPGVEHTLSQLGHTHTICLATNAAASEEDDIWKALARVAIHTLFDKVFCYRKVGHQKPSEAFFEYIVQDLQIPAERMIMVGDSFENDILGANRSGIFGIWFNERTTETKTGKMYTTIHDISELPKNVIRNT